MQFLTKDFLTLHSNQDSLPDGTAGGTPAGSEAQRALLAADSLRASGRLRLCVSGESMLPGLWPGDVIEIAACSIDDVQPGEIALALRDGRFFLHRFVARSASGGFLLRGDSMPDPDPEFSKSALIGRLNCPPTLRPWSQVVGRLLCYCGPARRFALRLHAGRRRRREIRDTAIACTGPDRAQARGQKGPRPTAPSPSISEVPHAGF